MTFTAVSYCTRTNSPRSRSWARESGLLVDEWLLERQPPADLEEQLVCAWRGDVGEARTLLPDECVDMYWVNGSVWVSGPETRSWPSAAAPGTDVVGVCFRSGVAPSLLGVAASELRDVRVCLDQLWGGGPPASSPNALATGTMATAGQSSSRMRCARWRRVRGVSISWRWRWPAGCARRGRHQRGNSPAPRICPNVSSTAGALPRSGTGLSFCCVSIASSASCSWLVMSQDRHGWPAWRSTPAMPTSPT